MVRAQTHARWTNDFHLLRQLITSEEQLKKQPTEKSYLELNSPRNESSLLLIDVTMEYIYIYMRKRPCGITVTLIRSIESVLRPLIVESHAWATQTHTNTRILKFKSKLTHITQSLAHSVSVSYLSRNTILLLGTCGSKRQMKLGFRRTLRHERRSRTTKQTNEAREKKFERIK